MAAAGPPGLGTALLYWWSDEGWQLGRIRRRCRRAPSRFTQVIGYRTPTAAFAGEVNTLLEPAADIVVSNKSTNVIQHVLYI